MPTKSKTTLTPQDIKNLKQVFATKDDLNEVYKRLNEAVDAIISAIDQMFEKHLLLHHQESGFPDPEIRDLKRRVKDLENDTPSLTEFNRLKKRVDTVLPHPPSVR